MTNLRQEYLVSGFTVILPSLVRQGIVPEASSIWPATVFPLAIASTTLIFGRLADMYGGRSIYLCGLIWLAIWSVIIGFSNNEVMMNISRAMQGIGASAILPSGLMLMGATYHPGTRKNMVFCIFGACGPFGFFLGIFVAGVAAFTTQWCYYFWVAAALSACTALVAFYTLPNIELAQRRQDLWYSTPSRVSRRLILDEGKAIQMDWAGGSLLGISISLILFSLIDSSQAPHGWKTPYIYVCFTLGIFLMLVTVWVEKCIAGCPLIPHSFVTKAQIPALLTSLFLFYGCLGIFLLHASQYMEQSMGANPLQVVAWYTPMIAGGCIISIFGGCVLHLVSGTLLLVIAGLAWITAPLLFAVAPQDANYWGYIFPSMMCATIGIDVTFNVCNIHITTNTSRNQQGFVGAIIAFLLHCGSTTCLALADIVKRETQKVLGDRKSCQAVFWLEVGCAIIATLILVAFVRVGEAKNDLRVEEKLEVVEKEENQHGGR